jgi:hypothetical protein
MIMLRKFGFWLWATAILQLLTGFMHGLGFFVEQKAENPTEDQMLSLMNTYKMDLGAGFHPTMMTLFLALSSCFTLICFFGGWLNIYLKRKNTPISVMKGVMGINAIIFGISFIVMAFLTFLPPTILTGLIFLCSVFAYFTGGRVKNSDISYIQTRSQVF